MSRGDRQALGAGMKVYFTPEAEAQVDEFDLWWRANRPKSPGLFARELAEAKLFISNTPKLGRFYRRLDGAESCFGRPGITSTIASNPSGSQSTPCGVRRRGGPRGCSPSRLGRSRRAGK